ncbi:uncharacterized protein LOC126315208 [Schistocerca gregaria]|uniref:uncharacterized protein LOC126315208 n=1 Tax=Schistocerca gregaria TaxID=7010 RepID=UPI00211DD9CD|nr:uncharacterized protein LOC126315208 [Schistocerca gregaria]
MSMFSRKRKEDTVSVSSLPPIETLELDRLKLFTREELTAYLKHYDIEAGETKPDLKRQLRLLITSVKTGVIPKREGIGTELYGSHSSGGSGQRSGDPKASTSDQSSFQSATGGLQTGASKPDNSVSTSVSFNTTCSIPSAPIKVPELRPNDLISHKSLGYMPALVPPQLIMPGFTSNNIVPGKFLPNLGLIRDLVVSRVDKKTAAPQQTTESMSLYECALQNLDPRANRSKSIKNTESQTLINFTPDDLTCVGCGKRANKECKFKRCKNCCNTILLRCPVHARNLVLLPGQVLFDPTLSNDANSNLALSSLNAPSIPSKTPFIIREERPLPPEIPLPQEILLDWPEHQDPLVTLQSIGSNRFKKNDETMRELWSPVTLSSILEQIEDKSFLSKEKRTFQENLKTMQKQLEQCAQEHENEIQSILNHSQKFFSQYSSLLETCQKTTAVSTNINSGEGQNNIYHMIPPLGGKLQIYTSNQEKTTEKFTKKIKPL